MYSVISFHSFFEYDCIFTDSCLLDVNTALYIISASLAIRIAEQSAIVSVLIDHVVPRLSVRTSVLWQNG